MNLDNIEAAQVARRVIDWATAVKTDERLLLLVDNRSDNKLAEQLWVAADRVGAKIVKVVVPYERPEPHGYLTWSEPPKRLAKLMSESDIVIGYMWSLLALTEAVSAARNGGTRFMWLPGSYDFSRPMILEEDWENIDQLGQKICNQLRGAHQIRITNGAGTMLTARLSAEREPFWDDARATDSGQNDFFPGGMWNTVPIIESVNGKAVFEGSLHPVGVLVDPIEVEYKNGKLMSIKGGRQAREWEHWLQSFGDERVYDFSHLSGGLAEKARTFGHDWEDLIIRGSILLSGGENHLYGGNNKAEAHYDGVVLDASLYIDDECILADGDYQL